MTDVELDARITVLEENSGGNEQTGNVFKFKSVKWALNGCWISPEYWDYLMPILDQDKLVSKSVGV